MHALSPLEYPWIDPPAPSKVQNIEDGLLWARMPLPFALDHINLWVLEDVDGDLTIVDTGLATDETQAIWDELLDGPLAGKAVRQLLCTHFHPDHMGLAGWLCQRFNAPLTTTLSEWAMGVILSCDTSEAFSENQANFYRRAGLNPEKIHRVEKRGNTLSRRVSTVPKRFNRIRHGDTLMIGSYAWDVIIGQGHSPEMACLYCPTQNILIAGDQVLPRISPNISVWPNEPDANPLVLYRHSLEALKDLVPDTALVLPSHGLPFRGLHRRIDAILQHHKDRLEDCLSACQDTPRSAADLLPVLFRHPLDEHGLLFAVGEAIAHIHLLEQENALERIRGVDHIDRFIVRRTK
ncbi:MBL fold metallo-hydrolase [Haematospirillum jordaniae]|uniref:MBL fold metallo-hydrolase n=1 Tax=Haematospirillum jordaniae TaxID=1549855 RepID=UPI001432996F|nr:MBL fold metallo-hydrolase [Haematospirillum jordaniae]NKD85615.1 MBL fold metallo-hydrolase [Haematospirillum jordaniae]